MNRREAAFFLGISVQALDYMVKKGKISKLKKTSGSVESIFDEDELREFKQNYVKYTHSKDQTKDLSQWNHDSINLMTVKEYKKLIIYKIISLEKNIIEIKELLTGVLGGTRK